MNFDYIYMYNAIYHSTIIALHPLVLVDLLRHSLQRYGV